jgi:acetolactate synthase-1/2/3 large subunit
MAESDLEKYACVIGDWLKELGYTHCFFVAGGGCMHLIDGFRSRFICLPVVHEVTAGIAAEHFNEVTENGRAFVLLTTGPGLTNAVTAIAGCYVEHRELLVIAGQVKSTDLKRPGTRQLGAQEVDGTGICKEISVRAERLTQPMSKSDFVEIVKLAEGPHPGPVVIEVCLDLQGAMVNRSALESSTSRAKISEINQTAAEVEHQKFWDLLAAKIVQKSRPVIVIGGLIKRKTAWNASNQLNQLGIPVLTTTSAIDRISSDAPVYMGRCGTHGAHRSANLILSQADLAIVLGAQLDLQQTGFDTENFAPNADLFQIFPCRQELQKGLPRLTGGLDADPNEAFTRVLEMFGRTDAAEWLAYARRVRQLVPVLEPANTASEGFILSFEFLQNLSLAAEPDDLLAVCSSGGAFTGSLQMYHVHKHQYASTSAAHASMGYGLATAIGMSFAHPGKRVILTEGDGGFCQNLQELAMVRRFDLPVKIFILANGGYASIRATQRKFFNGAYVGCDQATGLGFPDWIKLFTAFGIPSRHLSPNSCSVDALGKLLSENTGPEAWIVPIDPVQTNWPAVSSKLLPDGKLISLPLYEMLPPLDPKTKSQVEAYLPCRN